MDPRKLLYFASIIEHGSLTKAAKELVISQPALSNSMDRLEASLGVKLLERKPSGAIPTAAGELLYAHARSIKDEIDLADWKIKHQQEEHRPTLTFGALPSLTSEVVPLAVARWRPDHPGILLQVIEKVQSDLLISLLHRELDFIIGNTECYDLVDGLRQRVLFRDRLCVLARPDHPVFRLANISWALLVEFPWVCPMMGRYKTGLENLLRAQGLNLPRDITECCSVTLVKSLVAKSDHLALLPAHAVFDMSEGLVQQVPITVPQLNRNIAVFFREGSSLDGASRDLIACIESVGTNLCRDLYDTAGRSH